MLVDLSVLFKGSNALIIAATLSVVALIGKWLAATATSAVFHYSRDQRKLIFGLSSSHAAATLAVIMVGFQTKIIAENALNGTILLILITCLVATLVTENASRRILTSEEDEPEIKNLNSVEEHILIPIANLSNMERLLDLAMFIRNNKSVNPITILSVVPNNEEAEKNLIKAKKNLQELVKMASANETKVNIIASIDYNIASGIIRASREIMADTILIGWPGNTGLIERFIETKTASIISRTSKAVYICHFEYPLTRHKKIVIVCPPFAELEHGFGIWGRRLTNLSKELSTEIYCYCNEKSKLAIADFLKNQKINTKITFSKEFNLPDLVQLQEYILPDDLLVYIAARRNSVSYDNCMENIQEKLEKQFSLNSKIIIYPRTYPIDNKYNEYSDINSEPLNQGFEKFQKLGKDLGNLLKRDHPKP